MSMSTLLHVSGKGSGMRSKDGAFHEIYIVWYANYYSLHLILPYEI